MAHFDEEEFVESLSVHQKTCEWFNDPNSERMIIEFFEAGKDYWEDLNRRVTYLGNNGPSILHNSRIPRHLLISRLGTLSALRSNYRFGGIPSDSEVYVNYILEILENLKYYSAMMRNCRRSAGKMIWSLLCVEC